jgi:Tol biopolymer transport system component
VTDIRWLPDGSGFIVARQDALTDEDINLYEFTFGTGELRKLTDLSGEFARRFSIAPDGRSIVFERAKGEIASLATLPSDIWIMDREEHDPRLLVRNAAFPAWNPFAR